MPESFRPSSLCSGALLIVVQLLAPFDAGAFTIDGESVTGPEFLRRMGWIFGLIGGLLLAIGVGLWREREWARPLIVLYWVATFLLAFADGELDVGTLVSSAILFLGAAGFTVWYLYHKPNVRAYFEARGESGSVRGHV